ncbi:MAG: heavy-metal-associated domain-containing protein [Actinobacteria bacterium]|nr:heavy-metal-associated domain-containing protein [Actinomycetota bacterium]NIT98603.1 heavy-metal-associated domain-containing protein [Actinomycetota bacterium]NIX53579.1 copper ion binding protein [Actinomycetota bacterium]
MTNSTTLSVPDISCGHCKSCIEGAVGALDGIDRVEVAIDARTVDVTYDDGTVGIDRIIETIEDQGYEVSR